jgi:aminopeptidase
MLGEVAIVDSSSRVGQLGVVFFDTLFDENATSHVALGSAYLSALDGGTELSEDERTAAGLNESGLHADVMLGGPEVDIDGLASGGSSTAIVRGDRWVLA